MGEFTNGKMSAGNGGVKQPWLALDDTEFWFREQNLYLVNHLIGLTDADVAAIIQRIQSLESVGNPDKLPNELSGKSG